MESYHPPLGNYNQGTQTTTDHKLILHYKHLPTCLSEYQEMAYLFEIQPPKGALLLVINQFNLQKPDLWDSTFNIVQHQVHVLTQDDMLQAHSFRDDKSKTEKKLH